MYPDRSKGGLYERAIRRTGFGRGAYGDPLKCTVP